MTNAEIIKKINKQSILGFKKAETVIVKLKETFGLRLKYAPTSNGRLIDVLIKSDNGKVRCLLSNHSINGTFYISQMEAKNDRKRKKQKE